MAQHNCPKHQNASSFTNVSNESIVRYVGVGLNALKYLAFGIMLISGISIFIALFNTLKERKAEFALMRVNGAKRSQLLLVVLYESILLCVVGYLWHNFG